MKFGEIGNSTKSQLRFGYLEQKLLELQNDRNTYFNKLPEVQCRITCQWEIPEGPNLRGNPLLCDFTFRNATRFSLKIQERSTLGTNRRKKRIITMKYAQSIIYNKGIISQGKDFTIHSLILAESRCSNQTTEPSSFTKGRGGAMQRSHEDHSSETRAY